jgi:hypothetical protein
MSKAETFAQKDQRSKNRNNAIIINNIYKYNLNFWPSGVAQNSPHQCIPYLKVLDIEQRC